MRARPTRDLFDRLSDLLDSTESRRSVCLGDNTDLSIVVIDDGIRGPLTLSAEGQDPVSVSTMAARKRVRSPRPLWPFDRLAPLHLDR